MLRALLAQRVERILTEDDPDLEAQQVWGRTGDHREFGRLMLTQQVGNFAAHEPTHLRQVRASVPAGA